jgi:Ala-tRNA(Pro) deacylase
MNIVELLKKENVPFEPRHHPPRFTAQEVAAAEHVSGEAVAKVVVVKAGDRFVMCILPATYVLIMDRLKEILHAKSARLATEDEMAGLFPDTEIGAEPPFGGEYGLDLVAERHLAEDDRILVPAGTHHDSVLLKWSDFERVAHPVLASIGVHTT